MSTYKNIKVVLVTDCGSTTTKALLFENTDQGWRQTFRGEAPTTVEEPVADVTVGALNAFKEIEELSGRKILSQTGFIIPANNNQGIDLYLSTSSAGGGLQMLVCGVVKQITTESAHRAALGAGAIVLDAISADDGREDFERIERIRHLKPDIVLLCGGVDGGAKTQVLEMAETLVAAAPRPRFGKTLKLPIIYAGNQDLIEDIKEILKELAEVLIVSNLRSKIESENLIPAREAVHEFFLSHVMSHSPGYDKLTSWTPVPVMPTPAAVGDIVNSFSTDNNLNTLCVDIGGATTDVFSVLKNREEKFIFNRTVSANYGMSYSVANVLIEAGVKNIKRWLPYQISDSEIVDCLRNKMIRPTSIPQTKEDLWLEQAVCREALRLSLVHHKSLAVGLSGVTKQGGIANIFNQQSNRYDLLNLMALDLVIGSGGVLSHAPNRLSAALMLLDGFGLEGLTEIAVDSIFMMPHLGVLASINSEAASEIFLKDCLIKICQAIAPIYPEKAFKQKELALVLINGQEIGSIKAGEVKHIKGVTEETVLISIKPVSNKVNVGAGVGEILERKVTILEGGIILDGRNRPIMFPSSEQEIIEQQKTIFNNLRL